MPNKRRPSPRRKWFWRSDDYQEPQKQLRYPGTFFNGRVNPLIPYAIRGVIWYQGEGNWDMAYAYRNMLPLLIKDWRARWGQGDFPFLFVQLPNYGNVSKDLQPGEWCELRESQLLTLSLPNTAMAVAIDIGDAHDIHPKNKQDVAPRLALAARGIAYKEAIEYSGPIYRGMKVERASVRLTFDHCGSGLVAKGGELQQFAIAGDDKKFVWAQAKIDGDSVVVKPTASPRPWPCATPGPRIRRAAISLTARGPRLALPHRQLAQPQLCEELQERAGQAHLVQAKKITA